MSEEIEKGVWEALRKVKDPELKVNVVDAGMVRTVRVRDGVVEIEFALTTPFCPYTDLLLMAVRKAVEEVEGVRDVRIKVVGFLGFTPQR